MCGITGVIAFTKSGNEFLKFVLDATLALTKRGPDNNSTFFYQNIGFGHVRLSIIDTSPEANQPFTDETGRYTLVYNGEIFNFKEIKKSLELKGHQFSTNSDTEVLLKSYIIEGIACLEKLNGFFVFVIYDKVSNTTIIARDRLGIKPLFLFQTEDVIVFASEMKSLLKYPVKKELDLTSLYMYLQLNYIPGPDSIFSGIKKLKPGNFLMIKNNTVTEKGYTDVVYKSGYQVNTDYSTACKRMYSLLDDSVKHRLLSDVPLGFFLSGGIDSSIIVALASMHKYTLDTFSIGFPESSFFDESKDAKMVALKYRTHHTEINVKQKDIFENIYQILDYIDEPFADSSAIPLYMLCHETKKHVSVALTGDGADELFGGYQKHKAEYIFRNSFLAKPFARNTSFLWKMLPKSRNNYFGNKFRQLDRFCNSAKLSVSERYWAWCSLNDSVGAANVLSENTNYSNFEQRKNNILSHFSEGGDFNEVLQHDVQLVLQNDMLVKADLMSMANSLELRSPFLDRSIVDFAFSLPPDYKIHRTQQKRILRDTFGHLLPQEILNKPKHGFEVPLCVWLKNELNPLLKDYLSVEFITKQGIFNPESVTTLINKLFSSSPGDAPANIWALIVFQHWWRKYNT